MTDPKPYTENDPNECFRDLSNHNDSRFLATARAAAEADSLRAQLAKVEAMLGDLPQSLVMQAIKAGAMTVADVLKHHNELLNEAEAALTAAQGEVAVLRERLENTMRAADFATKLLTTSALPELHAGHTDAARWARALAHPTREPKP